MKIGAGFNKKNSDTLRSIALHFMVLCSIISTNNNTTSNKYKNKTKLEHKHKSRKKEKNIDLRENP
jgi:hypothetical protein